VGRASQALSARPVLLGENFWNSGASVCKRMLGFQRQCAIPFRMPTVRRVDRFQRKLVNQCSSRGARDLNLKVESMAEANSGETTNLKQRWLSSNPRRLFLWAVLVSFFCAWIGKPLVRVLHQRYIVARIQSMGGDVDYEYDFENGSQSLGKKVVWLFFGNDTFAHVTDVYIHVDRPFNEGDLAQLTDWPKLRCLILRGRHITDDSMRWVAQLPRLEQIGLVSTSVTADGLAQLSAVDGLETLMFHGQTVTDDMLQSIGTLRISSLGFMETQFTSAGFEQLARLSPVRRLAILDSTMNEGLPNLNSLHSLDRFFLLNVSVMVDGTSHRLHLDYTEDKLESLSLAGPKISAEGLAVVTKLNGLEADFDASDQTAIAELARRFPDS